MRALLIPVLARRPRRAGGPVVSGPAAGARVAPPRQGGGMSGMVSTAHPLATDAGLEILKAGGNAFDAAVAIAAALNVVEPAMSGMGGYGTILVWDAKDGAASATSMPSGRIPAAVDAGRVPRADAGLPGEPHGREGRVHAGQPARVGGPGEGLGPPELGAGARAGDPPGGAGIRARRGRRGVIAAAFDEFPEHARRIFGRDGKPLAAGDRLVQQDLARSLRAVVAARRRRRSTRARSPRPIDRAMRAGRRVPVPGGPEEGPGRVDGPDLDRVPRLRGLHRGAAGQRLRLRSSASA